MLFKKYRDFIKTISAAHPDTDGLGYSYEYVANLTSYSIPQIISIVQYLTKNGFVGLMGEPSATGFWLLEKALNYKDFFAYQVFKTVLLNVLLPVVAAFITTLITLSLQT